MIVGDSTQATTSTSYASSDTQEAQDDFLMLLVTQIQNQNPLDPMSNEEFTSQLTQFSMLEQLESVNANLTQDMIYSQSLNNTMMLDLVGRTATVAGDGVSVVDGDAGLNRLQVSSAGSATVEVLDEDGSVVASFVTDLQAGWNDVAWDGQLDDGGTAEDGDYSLSVTAVDAAGSEMAHQLYMTGLVDSIRFENNLAVLQVAGQEFYAAEIAEVGR